MDADAFGRCFVDTFLRARQTALLPDPHLGRNFEAGVPYDKRGLREQEVADDFRASLLVPDWVRLHVNVGDLLNNTLVAYEAILFAAQTYKEAAARRPDVDFAIIEGNHDSSKDAHRVSAFRLFREMVEHVPNILVVSGSPAYRHGIGLVPWNPFRTAAEVAADLQGPLECVVGHWDVENTGPNHIPTAQISLVTNRAYTGHEHSPGTLTRNGVEVIRVGSMQPYAHGEDPSGERYITLPLAEVETRLAEDPEAFKGRCLRIALRPGEEPPARIECNQISRLPLTVEGSEPPPPDEMLAECDVDSIFARNLAARGVGAKVAAEMTSRLHLSREEIAATA